MNIDPETYKKQGERYEFEICTAYFFEDVVLCEMKEGVTVCRDGMAPIVTVVREKFENRPFAYISHRVNSYSVVPTDYETLRPVTNLKAFAIVSNNILSTRNAKIEKLFFNRPLEAFHKFEDAIAWIKDILKKAS